MSINNAKWAKGLIVMAVLLLFSGFLHYYFSAKYQEILMNERNRVNLVSNQLEIYLNSRLMALQLLATDPEVISLDPEEIHRDLRRTVDLFGFFNAVVFDIQGNFIAEGAPEHHIDKIYDQESFDAAKTGISVISNRIVYSGTDSAYVSLRVPIRDAHGETKAVLVAGLPIQEISRMVESMDLSHQQYIFIIDKYIQMIHYPLDKYSSSDDDGVQQLQLDFMNQNKNKGEIINHPVIEKVEKKYLYTDLDNTEWRIIIAIPKTKLYTDMLRYSFTDIVIFFLIMLVIFLLYRALQEAKHHQNQVERLRLERLSCVNQLAAGLAHEIRNPLTSIKGFLQLIVRKHSASALQGYLDVMFGEIERMERLINEFQMLARPAKSKKMEKINLTHAVSDVILLMESQALNKNAVLDFYSDQIAWIKGDESQVKQVLINLVRNAIEAVSERGEIHVSLTIDAQTATVVVVDNGIGISEEVLNQLGTPFYTTKENGTGLGMSICYNIINSHGGKIKIDSKVGAGTAISVILPLLSEN